MTKFCESSLKVAVSFALAIEDGTRWDLAGTERFRLPIV